METTYYTPKEVADQLKLRVQTIYDYIRTGRLPAVRLGNRCRIAQSGLEAFLAHRKEAPPRADLENTGTGFVLPQGRTGLPTAEVSEQIQKNQAARQLLAEWMADETGYDEQAWPVVERLIQANPVAFRESTRD